MQWVAFHQTPSRALVEEEERIDMLARRLVFTGFAFCVAVVSCAWITTLVA